MALRHVAGYLLTLSIVLQYFQLRVNFLIADPCSCLCDKERSSEQAASFRLRATAPRENLVILLTFSSLDFDVYLLFVASNTDYPFLIVV